MIDVYINDFLIPYSDVKKIPEPQTEKLQFSFQSLIATTQSIDLNNIDKTKYDDEVKGSLLYNIDWYNANLKCIDRDNDLVIWNGRIKNIKKNDSTETLTIESANYIKEIVDSVCELTTGSTTNVTPSEIIYKLIVDVCGIPATALNMHSFDMAKAIQTTNNGFMIINFTKEANMNCGAVINEILRITSSYLYAINNILYYSQFQLYDGDHYTLIDESTITPSSYSSEYEDKNIYNDYSIVYKSSDSLIAYAVPDTTPNYILTSKKLYGTSKFLVPKDEVTSTLPSAYKILFKSLVSARYYGNLIRTASHYAKKVATFTIKNKIPDINLNTIVDVTYKHLQREPMRILEKKYNQKNNTISLKAEMVNFPYAVIDRDKTPPITVGLIDVKYGIENTVELYWTKSDDIGYKQYLIEFSTSITDFEREFSYEGYSPITVLTPIMKDGLCTYKISGLQEDAIYYFRIRVMDNAWNISDPSNILSLAFTTMASPEYTAEYYHCSGDLINGLTFVDGVGTAPSGYNTYDDATYDDFNYGFAGYHVSKYYICVDGFSKMVLKSNQPGTYYTVQCRTYADGVNGEWIDLDEYTSGIDNKYKIEFDADDKPEVIQFRIFFKPLNYSNTYNMIIDTVN